MLIYEIVGGVVFLLLGLAGVLWLQEHVRVRLNKEKDGNEQQ